MNLEVFFVQNALDKTQILLDFGLYCYSTRVQYIGNAAMASESSSQASMLIFQPSVLTNLLA